MRDAIRIKEDAGPGGHPAEHAEDQRTAPRLTILIRAAKIIIPEGEFLCVIRDASRSGISLRVFHSLPECRSVAIELQNGDRYDAEIVWQEEDRIGLRFARPADITRIIETPSQFARRPLRLNVEAPAIITTLQGAHDVTIHNISQQGASISTPFRYAIDQRVRLKARGLAETSATVRWRKDGLVGLAFEDTYQFGELARIVRMMNPKLPAASGY